jgi:hypothetical protein
MRHGDGMPKTNPDELLTTTQVGTLVERSGRTVIRMAEAGDIPVATKLPGPNGAHLFRRADAESLAAKLAERAETSA